MHHTLIHKITRNTHIRIRTHTHTHASQFFRGNAPQPGKRTVSLPVPQVGGGSRCQKPFSGRIDNLAEAKVMKGMVATDLKDKEFSRSISLLETPRLIYTVYRNEKLTSIGSWSVNVTLAPSSDNPIPIRPVPAPSSNTVLPLSSSFKEFHAC